MNRTKALDSIDRLINQYLIDGDGIVKEMALAIHVVNSSARANSQSRLGSGWKNSSRNLSNILTKEILPVLYKLQVGNDLIRPRVFECINNASKPEDILKAADIIKRLILVMTPLEQSALDLLYQFLIRLVNDFSPNNKKVKQPDDGIYCRFCYREARINFDSCSDHSNTGRNDGKRDLERFRYISNHLTRNRDNEKISNEFVLRKLKASGLSIWNGEIDDIDWIKKLLKSIRASSVDDEVSLSIAAKKIIESSSTYVPLEYSHKDWPRGLEGTLLRYKAFKLNDYRVPSEKVAKRLNKIWSGANVSEVTVAFNINREQFYRAKLLWGRIVDTMRLDGIEDNVIKMVLGLEFLPIKTGYE